MFDPISIVLEFVADKLFGKLIEMATDRGATDLAIKLRGAPARNTFKQALGAAIQRYASTGTRLDLASPLMKKDGLFANPQVIEELAHVIRFDRDPNAELIGKRWKALLDQPPAWRDFTYEANLLLEYLRTELRATDTFRPVFETKSLDSIASEMAASTKMLSSIETQLEALNQLNSAGFASLSRAFSAAQYDIHEQIRDYSRFIAEKTRGFVGRQFMMDAVAQFVNNNPRGYMFLRGDPGIGKTAFLAQLVKLHGYVHHFNIRAEGVCRSDAFLKNVCAQMVATYQLDHHLLPPDVTQDAGFLNKLLGEISEKIPADQKAVIIVDALDEVDHVGLPSGVNLLYLPVNLPERIFFVVSTRKIPISLRIDCEQATLDIEHDSAGNIADIREYVEQFAVRQGIKDYIVLQNLDTKSFVDHLVTKSEGNFMYLRYVLPEIEAGAYKDLGLDAVPVGLQNYYEDHWRRMRGKDEEGWFVYKLPVIMALTVVKQPVSIDLIADFAGVQEKSRIRTVLVEWEQFLHVEDVEYEGALQKRYSMYHASFHDFIAKKEEVADERVSRVDAHRKIADRLWTDLFGDGKTV